MTSPFPGMDPYLERFWGDVHTRFINYACDQIQDRLPPGLVARMQERVVIEPPDPDDRSFYPDIHGAEPSRAGDGGAVAVVAEAVDLAEPLLLTAGERLAEVFIEVID